MRNVLFDVCMLSSGTLATLTGLRRYDQLDRFSAGFVNYVSSFEPGRFGTWQEAYEHYKGYLETKESAGY